MYIELYRAWKSEKTSHVPQPLPSDFYQRTESYLKNLGEETTSSDTHTIQGRLLIKEKEIAGRLLDELREARLRKIIENAKNGNAITTDGLTDEEQDLANRLNNSLASFKEKQTETKKEQSSQTETDLVVVRFLQDIPEIVGVDLKIYGPYRKEDVGSLPAQNAQGLVRQGAARLIEVRGIHSSWQGAPPINNK
jgi:DNA replication factor GINS